MGEYFGLRVGLRHNATPDRRTVKGVFPICGTELKR